MAEPLTRHQSGRNALIRVAAGHTRLWYGLVGFALFFLALEWFTRLGLVSPRFLPPASRVAARAGILLTDAEFLGYIAETLRAWAAGLGLSALIGIPAGILIGSSHFLYQGTRGIIEFLRPIPSVALVPLGVLLLGNSLEMKAFVVVMGALWPILFNTIYGMHETDPMRVQTAKVFGYGRVATLAKISLPGALPFIYTGVRVAAAIALILAISAEILAGGAGGLGSWMLLMGLSGGAAEQVYAGTFLAGVLGWLINALLVQGEKRLVSWHAAMQGIGQ